MRAKRIRLAVGLAGLSGALALAGCMLQDAAAPQKVGTGLPGVDAAAGTCAAQLAAAGPYDMVPTWAAVTQLRTNRLRLEFTGQVLVGPQLTTLGTCATTAAAAGTAPQLAFTGGSANIKIGGSSQSIVVGADPVTQTAAFGLLAVPVGEPGVVLATDASGNVLEIIWPELAGVGVGPAIVRVQLANWDRAAASAAGILDMNFDLTASATTAGGVPVIARFVGAVAGVPLDGTPVTFVGAPAPCPAALSNTTLPMTIAGAGIVQFRAARLRMEAVGDAAPTGVTLDGLASCLNATPAGATIIAANAKITKHNSTSQVTTTHKPLAWTGIATVVGEVGVVLAADAQKNVFEIIWPSLSGAPPGPPIVRVQLAAWDPARVVRGKALDLTYDFTVQMTDAVTGVVSTNKFTGIVKNLIIP